jgi:carboxymethylenebutenolidase
MAEALTLDAAGAALPVYEVVPTGAARGAIVVLQEAFGVNGHIEDVTRRFAAEGYRAVAPHLFHRTGDPVIPYEKVAEVVPHFTALDEQGLFADLDATVAHLSAAGFEATAIGVVGFCMGGTVTFMSAVQRRLGAAVTFYGSGLRQGRFGMPPLVELAPRLQTPWLGLFGDDDGGIPVDEVESLREAVADAAVDTEIVRYPGAEHGFFCDVRPSYAPDAAADAWRRTLDWLDQHLAGTP